MSSKQKSKLNRARAKLQRKLSSGWERAVFTSPARADGTRDEEVLEGPGPLAAESESESGSETETATETGFEAAFAALWAAAEQAAARGLVKICVVIDPRHRVEIDARHGHVKARVLDDATVDKIMGGKDRALRPDRSAALLRAIGIMNADGSISARSAKKYKQVNHFVELCRPVWTRLLANSRAEGPLRVVDLACGNSYLSFVLLEALRLEGQPGQLLGIDRREDVITSSRERAAQVGFGDDARFEAMDLEQLDGPALARALGGPADLAISLHACDTATDYALALGIRAELPAILCAPCCQAELARQLEALEGEARAASAAGVVPALLDHGLMRRGLGELLTDGLRVELLAACGYEVSVVEFVAAAHTPKNLLLRALRRPRARGLDEPETRAAIEAVAQRCAALGVRPRLLALLGG